MALPVVSPAFRWRFMRATCCAQALYPRSKCLRVLKLRALAAVQPPALPGGGSPVRQLLLQPVAIGAVVEVTKRLKPSVKRVHRDLASTQAVTSSERCAD